MRAAPLAQRPRSRPASSAQRRRPHPLRPRAAAADTPPPDPAALRTPHSGYHDDGSGRRFFEGWYFKVRGERERGVTGGRGVYFFG